MELNGVEFNRKPILIGETRSQPKQCLNFDLRFLIVKIHKIYYLQKNHRRTHHLYGRNKTPTTIIHMLLNQEKKNVFFSDSIPKNLKMKNFHGAVKGRRVHLKSSWFESSRTQSSHKDSITRVYLQCSYNSHGYQQYPSLKRQ